MGVGRSEGLVAGNKKPLVLNRDLAQDHGQLAVLEWLPDTGPGEKCQPFVSLLSWSEAQKDSPCLPRPHGTLGMVTGVGVG